MTKLSDHEPDSREIRNITDALINLYAAYVNSSLFSYDNPLITDSLKNAYNCLQSVFRKKKVVHLETAEGRLMFEGVMLEGDMLVLSNVAAWLSSRNIKKLTISDDLMRRELANFHKLISTKVSGNEELAKAMSEKNITSIIVQEAEPADSGGPEKALLDKTADQGTVGIYDGTMYQTDRGDAAVSGESMFHNGLPDFYMNTMFDLEGGRGSASSFSAPSPMTSPGEENPTNHNASCVEALLEHDVSDDEREVIRNIPPDDMAGLLNAMLLFMPGYDILTRIIDVYIFGSESSEDLQKRNKVFFNGLKPALRNPLWKLYLSRGGSRAVLEDIELAEMPDAPLHPNTSSATADAESQSSAFHSPARRTLDGCAFVFDLVAGGKALLDDIELDAGTACLLNQSNLELTETATMAELIASLEAKPVGERSVATIVQECADEVILQTSFEVLVELAESDALEGDMYDKLQGRLASLAHLFVEKGDFESVLTVFNALKTQSLQGRNASLAAGMISRIFSSDEFNSKAVNALIQHGRKRRESAEKLAVALRHYLMPYLLDALGEEQDTSRRKFFLTILTSEREDALPHIVRRLRDNRWYVIRNMLYLLRECKGRNYADQIRDFLEHEVPAVRLEALRTLLSFGQQDAEPYVIKFLMSDVFQLQKGAVLLAGAYRIKATVPHLITLLREKDVLSKKVFFKRTIVRVLGRIGDGRAVSHLLYICRSTNVVNKKDIDQLKTEIFRTLHHYPAAVIGPLLEYGRNSSNKDIAAICSKLANRFDESGRKK